MMKKTDYNPRRASFTVEASVILPMICIILAMLIQAAFYLHDVSMLSSAAYEGAVYAAKNELNSDKDPAAVAKERTQQALLGRTFACRDCTVEASSGLTSVNVSVSGSLLYFGGLSVHVNRSALLLNPITSFRLIELGKDTINTISSIKDIVSTNSSDSQGSANVPSDASYGD